MSTRHELERLPDTPEPMHYWPGAGGLRIAGDAWGNPSGPLVLLQHGGGQTRHAWKGAGEKLGGAGYFAVAFDARGHGDSDWAEDGDYGVDAMIADLNGVIAALGRKSAILVGASMGGATSLAAAGGSFVDAAALVLVDTAHRIEVEGVSKIQEFMTSKPDGFESLEEVALAIGNYQPHRSPPKNLRGLAKNLRRGPTGRFVWHWDPAFRPDWQALLKRQPRLTACVKNLRIPTLLVRGGLSDVLSEDGAREFLDICPSAEYANVTGAGHMVAGDRNDIFANAVIDFLSRRVPVSG